MADISENIELIEESEKWAKYKHKKNGSIYTVYKASLLSNKLFFHWCEKGETYWLGGNLIVPNIDINIDQLKQERINNYLSWKAKLKANHEAAKKKILPLAESKYRQWVISNFYKDRTKYFG